MANWAGGCDIEQDMASSPNSIIWLVTGRCNLACPHCYAVRFRGQRELSPEEAEVLLEEAAAAGVRHLGLGGGEPLLRPDLLRIIHRARSLGMGVTLVTNGAVVSRSVARRFAREGVGVVVSLDGASAQTHDRRRGTGSHEKALAALAHLKEAGASYRIIMALGPDNYREVEDYVALAQGLGAEAACLIPVMPSGRAKWEMVLTPTQLVEALKAADRGSLELKLPVQLWCIPFAPLMVSSAHVSASSCRESLSMDIDPAGNVLLCDVLDIVVSTVRRNGLLGAWQEQCRSTLVSRLECPELPPVCAACPLSRRCRGGCFARAQLLVGNLYAPDPLCPRVADLC